MLVDSHCHLDGPKFAADRAEVLRRAVQAGVETIVAIGNGDAPGEMGCALELAEEFDPEVEASRGGRKSDVPRIYCTAGIHPHEAKLATDADFERLSDLARHPRVVAIGELGMDYHYDNSPREMQRDVFVRQLAVARAAGKPIVIHCRPSDTDANDAWDDLFDRLRRHWTAELGGVMHCFTGTLEQARASLDLGFMLSFAGNVTYPKAQGIRDAAAFAPPDRLLLETDSPYLAPVPHRGKRNEPALVAETATFVAGLRGVSAQMLGETTTANFRRCFRLD